MPSYHSPSLLRFFLLHLKFAPFFIAGRFFPEKGIFSFLSSGISYTSFSFLFEVGRRFLVVDR